MFFVVCFFLFFIEYIFCTDFSDVAGVIATAARHHRRLERGECRGDPAVRADGRCGGGGSAVPAGEKEAAQSGLCWIARRAPTHYAALRSERRAVVEPESAQVLRSATCGAGNSSIPLLLCLVKVCA